MGREGVAREGRGGHGVWAALTLYYNYVCTSVRAHERDHVVGKSIDIIAELYSYLSMVDQLLVGCDVAALT